MRWNLTLPVAAAVLAAAIGVSWILFASRGAERRAAPDRDTVAGPARPRAPRPRFQPRPRPAPATDTDFAGVLQAARDRIDEEAGTEWAEQTGPLLKQLRRDPVRARAFLEYLGQADDAEAALYGARVLPFVWAKGFDRHLADTATGEGEVLLRRVALIGLRGRGPEAATAVAQVARSAQDPALRTHATKELAGFLRDPAVVKQRPVMLDAVIANLDHELPDVRVAALQALVVDRRPVAADLKARLEVMAAEDTDETARLYAKRLCGQSTVPARASR